MQMVVGIQKIAEVAGTVAEGKAVVDKVAADKVVVDMAAVGKVAADKVVADRVVAGIPQEEAARSMVVGCIVGSLQKLGIIFVHTCLEEEQ